MTAPRTGLVGPTGQPLSLKQPPPIKASPTGVDDGFDAARIQLVRGERWDPQTGPLLGLHRTIEENVRVLSGRQWDVWSELLGAYVDVSRYMTDEERRWRQRPVVNLLQYWFMLTHARLTENPPLPNFQPSTLDRLSQQLADALNPITRTLWADVGMDDAFTRCAAWLIVAGEVYLETAVDFTQGDVRSLQGPAMLSMPGPDGQMIQRPTSGPVPYDQQGNPLAQLTADGSGYEVPDGIEGFSDNEGCLVPRVRSPLEVRSEWGGEKAWEDKRWIITRSYLTPQEVYDIYQIEVQPEPDLGDGSAGFLHRLLFSSGYFGAVSNRLGSQTAMEPTIGRGSHVAVDTMWEKPSPFSPETDDSPGGRLLIVTGTHVLHDSPRPYRTKAAGPIRRAQFIQQPGRAGHGSTPLEQMVPIQKTYNRGWAQILEHRNLSTNPILVVDSNSGIADEFSNVPGSKVEADFTVNTQPAYYLNPPQLSGDVWRIQSMLLDIMMRLGSIAGAEGQTPTEDASGELVSQLRFNSDRPVSIAARSLAQLIAGVVDDWRAILPTIWTDEKTLSYIGEDQVFRTITLTPEIWDGDVRVRPDLENAQIEAPEAKMQRAMQLYEAQVFGLPGSPEALARFAQYARTAGLEDIAGADAGVDADMIRQIMSQIAQGVPMMEAVGEFEEWYDYGTWSKVMREHLASPEFKKYPPQIQQQFRLFWVLVQHAGQAQIMTQMQRQAPVAAQVAATQGAIQGTAAASAHAHGPPPEQHASNASKKPQPSADDSASADHKAA